MKKGLPGAPPEQVLVNVKDSIFSLFMHLIQPNLYRTFALADIEQRVYVLIFINGLQYDSGSHAPLADTCIIPLDMSLSQKLHSGSLMNESVMSIKTTGEETKAWQYLLPSFVERCRTWPHLPSCQYIKSGIPVSSKHCEPSICSCGRGVDLGEFGNVRKNLAQYATRAAISPLFAISYLESVAGDLNDYDQLGEAKSRKCARCGGGGDSTLLQCGRCKARSYCGKECQRLDWSSHKKSCKAAV